MHAYTHVVFVVVDATEPSEARACFLPKPLCDVGRRLLAAMQGSNYRTRGAGENEYYLRNCDDSCVHGDLGDLVQNDAEMADFMLDVIKEATSLEFYQGLSTLVGHRDMCPAHEVFNRDKVAWVHISLADF